MDADRMDYLLRDSYHSGVTYGKYDLDRVVNSVCLCFDPESDGHVVGTEEGGLHAVEGLLIARYMMFTQVYFHKTRVSLDHHYDQALKNILGETGQFPPPTPDSIKDFVAWDDWRMLSAISANSACPDSQALSMRNHARLVYFTPECPDDSDIAHFEAAAEAIKDLNPIKKDAKKSWYKFDNSEIRLRVNSDKSVPLTKRSPVVDGLRAVSQRRLYVAPDMRQKADELLRNES